MPVSVLLSSSISLPVYQSYVCLSSYPYQSLCLSSYLYASLSVYLSIYTYQSVCLSVHMPVFLSVCLSRGLSTVLDR